MSDRAAPPPGFLEISRQDWSALGGGRRTGLTGEDLEPLRGVNESLDLDEVRAILLPLANYLRLRAEHEVSGRLDTFEFLGLPYRSAPYTLGIAGSVAAGKSTLAKVIQVLLEQAPEQPVVTVVGTDSFLFSNEELQRRGILHRKGFPETYDWPAMLSFMAAVRMGEKGLAVPVYSHLEYDLIPGEAQPIDGPDILVVEGLNVLQTPPLAGGEVLPSDLIDLSVYVDVQESDLHRWFVERFLALRATTFTDPRSFFHEYATLDDEQAIAVAERVWKSINGRNLREHIAPTRHRADVVLAKGSDHRVQEIHLRLP